MDSDNESTTHSSASEADYLQHEEAFQNLTISQLVAHQGRIVWSPDALRIIWRFCSQHQVSAHNWPKPDVLASLLDQLNAPKLPVEAYADAATRTLSALRSRVSSYKPMVALQEHQSGTGWVCQWARWSERWFNNPDWNGDISMPKDVTPWERGMRPIRAADHAHGPTWLVKELVKLEAKRVKGKLDGKAGLVKEPPPPPSCPKEHPLPAFGAHVEAFMQALSKNAEKERSQDLVKQNAALQTRAREVEAREKAAEIQAAKMQQDLSEKQEQIRILLSRAQHAEDALAATQSFVGLAKSNIVNLEMQLETERRKNKKSVGGGGDGGIGIKDMAEIWGGRNGKFAKYTNDLAGRGGKHSKHRMRMMGKGKEVDLDSVTGMGKDEVDAALGLDEDEVGAALGEDEVGAALGEDDVDEDFGFDEDEVDAALGF
ncbi:hypothetical protein AC578_9856 [Pseudocercospora eumusae]|uniref:Uncharacterized protein n=1 Tax=Pseudocercospora eumusae TaxID=321146 RepID=A0A139HB05_9PEZI|nr:hypothetical protein AC578_9856 [Pseudocercospora eumusae]